MGKHDGIICFVSNNSFVDQIAFDGMRKHLAQDFTRIDHIDLHGNVRRNPKLSGTTHNVFGIQVGVGITVAVRSKSERLIHYHRVPEFWRKEEKLIWLRGHDIHWQAVKPDLGHAWLIPENSGEYTEFLSVSEVFSMHSRGVATCRDDVVWGFDQNKLANRVQQFIDLYNSEVDRYARSGKPKDIDNFVSYNAVKWSESLKANLSRSKYALYSEKKLRLGTYRSFIKKYLFFDPILIERVYQTPKILPLPATQNSILCFTNHSQVPFSVIATNLIPECAPGGRPGQTFPFYTYKPNGTEQTENITDAALQQFRSQYKDQSITKWNIFHYIYGVLHHPNYREKFAENLRRELPRIPFAPNFHAFAEAGRELAELHIGYEQLKPWPLEFIENPAVPFSWRVERMRLNKDKTALTVNGSLTLAQIPPAVFHYRLGNRSALEWVIDQYRVTEDARSGIRSDPNREDDPEYIVRLVGQVVRVSLETVRIVNALPEQYA